MPVQDPGEDGVHRCVVKVVDGDGVEMAHEACCYRVPASTLGRGKQRKDPSNTLTQ